MSNAHGVLVPLHSSSGQWRLGLGLSLLTVFLWGILPIALTVTLQALDIYTIIWFRFLVSFGLLAVYLGIRQKLPFGKATVKSLTGALPRRKMNSRVQRCQNAKEKKLSLLPFGFHLSLSEIGLLAIATIFLALNYILFLRGLTNTSPANAQVIIQLAPVLMGLGGVAIFKERYTLHQWVGLSVLTLGFVLFFHEQIRTLITARGEYLVGCGFIALAAVTWAIYSLAQKQLLQTLPSTNIMLLIYGGCALFFSPFATPVSILRLNPLHLGMLLFCALNTIIAYGAFAESLEHWEASRVSAVLSLTPLVTLTSVWILSFFMPTLIATENLTDLGLFGAALVVSGSVATALGKTH